MINLEIKSRMEDVVRRMSAVCLTHKTEMRKLEHEIREIQSSCKHAIVQDDRCLICGKQGEDAK